MKSRVKDKDVDAHIFEYTTTFALDPELRFRYPDKGIVPTQIIFCLKEQNAKKIDGLRWFFNAFSKVLQVRRLFFGCLQTVSDRMLISLTSVFYWTSAPDQAQRVFTPYGRRSM